MTRIVAIRPWRCRRGGRVGRQCSIRMQIVEGKLRVGQRPCGRLAPVPAMLETASGIAAPAATPHDEDPHRRFGLDTIVPAAAPAVETASAQGTKSWHTCDV